MSFTIIDAEQRSPEWFIARAGRVTGSRCECIWAKGKAGGEAVTRRDYRLQLVCERLTGIPESPGYVNADMQRGIDIEPLSFAAYEARSGEMVQRSGFIAHDEWMMGASLDGHIGDFEGIVELKNPKTNTHIGYLKDPSSLAAAYEPQIRHALFISGAKWCDIVSFDNRLPEKLQMVTYRVQASAVDLRGHWMMVVGFLEEVDREVAALSQLAS